MFASYSAVRVLKLVQRLFEQEIPELGEEIIAVKSISREPGYRSKVAVSSVDTQVDPIAVCVGYRGSRIKAVREELAGEHIDVVRFSDDPEVLIPNALQPAEVEQVLLCDMIGRAIVLVQEDQLSLAIGASRAKRSFGQQALRLGHRNHDRWRARGTNRTRGGRILHDFWHHRRSGSGIGRTGLPFL